jgi:hypothetical protein
MNPRVPEAAPGAIHDVFEDVAKPTAAKAAAAAVIILVNREAGCSVGMEGAPAKEIFATLLQLASIGFNQCSKRDGCF